MEGREPEEEEVLMTGWVMGQGREVCQEETEEMKTPEDRRIADPVPSPPPREVVGEELVVRKGTTVAEISAAWWRRTQERWRGEGKEGE